MHKMVISCLAVRQTGILLYFVRQSPVIYTYIKFKFCLVFFFRKTTLFKLAMLFYLSFIMHKCIIYRKQIIEYIYINEKVIISVKIAITLKVTYNCLLKLNYYILSLHLFYFTSLKHLYTFISKLGICFILIIYTSIFSAFPEKLGFP